MNRVHEYYEEMGELFKCAKCGDEHEVYEPADFFNCKKDKKAKSLDEDLKRFIEKWNKQNVRKR